MKVRSIGLASCLLIAVFAIACGSSSRGSLFGPESDHNDAGPSGDFGNVDAGTSECAVNNTSSELDKDFDGDGYALKDDCNECNTSINKGALDIPGNGIDEDCSGTAEVEAADCDTGLPSSGSDPFDGAKAIGLCKKATADGREWGVVEAEWVMPDGKSLSNKEGIGILKKFGVNVPQMGDAMLVLSSGSADDTCQDNHNKNKNYTHGTPAGYPKGSTSCPAPVTTGEAHDGVALRLKIRVPSNAKSFAYQQNFFTMEYPSYVCDDAGYNDFFVTMMDPIPDGLPDGNIAFDQDGNPISVNNSLLRVCKPGRTSSGQYFTCPLGDSSLAGTCFEGAGATGWLTTTASVTPGSEITLLFAIWDSRDGDFDSTVLIDDFKFSIDETQTPQTKPSDPR